MLGLLKSNVYPLVLNSLIFSQTAKDGFVKSTVGSPKIVIGLVIKLSPQILETVSVTLYTPGTSNITSGLCEFSVKGLTKLYPLFGNIVHV